jgi:hypothetical protein
MAKQQHGLITWLPQDSDSLRSYRALFYLSQPLSTTNIANSITLVVKNTEAPGA